MSQKSFSVVLMSLFLSMHTMSLPVFCQQTIYDFSDEAQAQFDQQTQSVDVFQAVTNHQPPTVEKKQDSKTLTQTVIQNQTQSQLHGSVVYIPADTEFPAVLQSAISSDSLAKGDMIAAVLQDDWIYNFELIAPKGSILYGKAVEVKKAGAAYGNGSMEISFSELITPKGEKLTLVSNIVKIKSDANRAGKITKNVVTGAVVGLILTAVRYLITGSDNWASHVAVGAAVGAAGGGITAVMNKGEEVHIPAGTMLDIKLVQPMNVIPYQ